MNIIHGIIILSVMLLIHLWIHLSHSFRSDSFQSLVIFLRGFSNPIIRQNVRDEAVKAELMDEWKSLQSSASLWEIGYGRDNKCVRGLAMERPCRGDNWKCERCRFTDDCGSEKWLWFWWAWYGDESNRKKETPNVMHLFNFEISICIWIPIHYYQTIWIRRDSIVSRYIFTDIHNIERS